MRIGVVGAGITGLSVTYELARLGHEVRCFEAATPMAARSTGDTRIFRLAHDRPELVEWAMRARRGWDAWSATAGEQFVGREGNVVSGDIASRADAMSAAGAPHLETDNPPNVPADRPQGPFLIDPDGGVIHAERTGRFLMAQISERVAAQPVTAVTVDGELFNIASVPVTRYLYRGSKIPTPWSLINRV
jgi:sarcosine oxidase